MKRVSVIAGFIVAFMVMNLYVPQLEIEDHMTSFLRNNLNKMMHWINLGALV